MSPRTFLRGALAVLGPMFVVSGAIVGLAGGGPAPAGPTRTEVDAEIAAGADVVVLGNSMSWTDLDARQLADSFGVERVARPRVAGSGAPAWLAVLEARVFGEGYRPRLVVVYGTLDAMLAGKPASAVGMERLDDVLGGYDGIVSRRVLKRTPGILGRLGPARSRFHTSLLDGVRDSAVGLVFGGEGEDLLARGASVSHPALETLFGEKAQLRGGGAARVVPVVEQGQVATFSDTVSLAESVVPDLIRVAHTGGARIVFVRGPDRPLTPAGWALNAQGAAIVELTNRVGAAYVDLSYLPAPPGNFRDNIHMNAAGRTQLMAALLPELERLNPLGDAPMPPSTAAVTPLGVRREGTASPVEIGALKRVEGSPCRWQVDSPPYAALGPGRLATIGLGERSPLSLRVGDASLSLPSRPIDKADPCSPFAALSEKGLTFAAPADVTADRIGLTLSPDFPFVPRAGSEVWWVYPGTHAVVDVGGEGALWVELSGRRLGSGPASLQVGDQRVDLPEGQELFTVRLPAAERADRWSIEVGSNGPFVVIDELAVGEGERRRVLLGGFDAVVTGVARLRVPPRPLPLVAEGDAFRHPLLSALGVEQLEPLGLASCLPLRVTADGERLDGYAGVRPPQRGGPRFSVSEGLLRVNRPGAVLAELAEVRNCGGGVWYYPDESVSTSLTVPWQRLRVGADLLVLDLRALGLGEADSVHVKLADTRRVLADLELDAAALAEGPVTVPLEPAYTTPAGKLTLELDNPSPTGFLNLRGVEFRDGSAGR